MRAISTLMDDFKTNPPHALIASQKMHEGYPIRDISTSLVNYVLTNSPNYYQIHENHEKYPVRSIAISFADNYLTNPPHVLSTSRETHAVYHMRSIYISLEKNS